MLPAGALRRSAVLRPLRSAAAGCATRSGSLRAARGAHAQLPPAPRSAACGRGTTVRAPNMQACRGFWQPPTAAKPPHFGTSVPVAPVPRVRAVATSAVGGNGATTPVSAAATATPAAPADVDTGVLNTTPMVAPADETARSAMKRALKLTATAGLCRDASEAQKARKRAAQQLDALTKELCAPLAAYVRGFPAPARLHPFERALLDLTVGTTAYERALARVDALRKGLLEVGKGHASYANRATTEREADTRRKAGCEELDALFRRGGGAVDELKEMAKALRALPVAELRSPTVALVGAPNVGKSSIVRLLSTGTPEVANYPFTTRGVAMGHVLAPDGARCVLTDTPGVLLRPDEVRNRMERLTLAALAYLPCGVVFVADLSGRCGTPPAEQLLIRQELRRRAPGRPWMDVLSKWDLCNEDDPRVAGIAAELPDALRLSVTESLGTEELRERMAALLAQTQATGLTQPPAPEPPRF